MFNLPVLEVISWPLWPFELQCDPPWSVEGITTKWVFTHVSDYLKVDFKINRVLVLALAFTQGGLGRHHQLRWPRLGRRHSRLDGPARAHYTQFHPVLAEDSRSGEWFQVGLGRGCRCLQLASSASSLRARCYGMEKVLDQLTFGTSCSMTIPAEPSLYERRGSSTDGTQSLRLTRRRQRMLLLSKTSNILSSVTGTGHVSRIW